MIAQFMPPTFNPAWAEIYSKIKPFAFEGDFLKSGISLQTEVISEN